MKSGFQTGLSVKLKDNSDRIWIVTGPLKYWSELLNRLLVVPVCFETETPPTDDDLFETDFASVPRIPVIYEAWGDRAHREAVLHDAMYRKDFPGNISFSMANKVFLEAMESTGKPFYIRWPMYLGVCAGGWSSYHKLSMRDKL